VDEIAADTVREELSAPIGNFRLGSFTLPRGVRRIIESTELLSTLQTAGYDILVVSGSNRWSVSHVCAPLGVSKEKTIGIGLHEKNETFRDIVELPVPVLEGKVEALRQAGIYAPAVVISNSVYDAPLFEMSAGPKVLLQSDEDGRSFFQNLGVVPDDTWFIVEHPTLIA
jgi:phosphoserine phosphatase